jgi:GDP-D-mannose 3', 5'-epimerase
MRKCAVLGGAGFVGAHLVKRLRRDGCWVRAVDLHPPPFAPSQAHEFVLGDLRDPETARAAVEGCEAVYQLATAMGGADYIFTGRHDAYVMHTACSINLNVAEASRLAGVQRLFFPSSACVYPQSAQAETSIQPLREDMAYPAEPDSEYGWEKLFAERLYLAYQRNYGLSVCIARFHSIVGPEGTWTGGKEKVFAALCRKVAEAPDGGSIEIYGDGEQTRTFLYIDECLEGIERLMASGHSGPVNLGAPDLISINDLASTIMQTAGKSLSIVHRDGPLGVRGRRPDQTLLRSVLGWEPSRPLSYAVDRTYPWVRLQVEAAQATL